MIRALLAMLVTYGLILLLLRLVPSQLFISGWFVWLITSTWFFIAAVGGSICALTSRNHPVIRALIVVSVGMMLILVHANWGALVESIQSMVFIATKSTMVAGTVAFLVATALQGSNKALQRTSR
ncbi:hypothetical protein [Halopseudomonas salegens]|uniref:hypothetical protein n=1 Tax=Halopseudomonas salegens TaxID=1434072 RepID=UPI000B821EEA|nr:hypothetical protein [Halopseudomonas salegens]